MYKAEDGWRVEGFWRESQELREEKNPLPEMHEPWVGQEDFIFNLEKMQPEMPVHAISKESVQGIHGILKVLCKGRSSHSVDSASKGSDSFQCMVLQEFLDMDNKVQWPECLLTYVNLYNVKPSGEFIDYVTKRSQDTFDHNKTAAEAEQLFENCWKNLGESLYVSTPGFVDRGILYTECRGQFIRRSVSVNPTDSGFDLTLVLNMCRERTRKADSSIPTGDELKKWVRPIHRALFGGYRKKTYPIDGAFGTRLNLCPFPCREHVNEPLFDMSSIPPL
jgi:hypothetical protein